MHAAFLEKSAPFGKRSRQAIKRRCDECAMARIAQRGKCSASEQPAKDNVRLAVMAQALIINTTAAQRMLQEIRSSGLAAPEGRLKDGRHAQVMRRMIVAG